MSSIVTARLILVSMSRRFLELCAAGDRGGAERELGFCVAEDWWAERDLIRFRLTQLRADATLEPWLLRAVIRKADHVMVGHFNGHGRPGMEHLNAYCEHGIEVGYTIYREHRRKGYASETVLGFQSWAQEQRPGVRIALSIDPGNTPSLAMAAKLGFDRAGVLAEGGESEILFLSKAVAKR